MTISSLKYYAYHANINKITSAPLYYNSDDIINKGYDASIKISAPNTELGYMYAAAKNLDHPIHAGIIPTGIRIFANNTNYELASGIAGTLDRFIGSKFEVPQNTFAYRLFPVGNLYIPLSGNYTTTTKIEDLWEKASGRGYGRLPEINGARSGKDKHLWNQTDSYFAIIIIINGQKWYLDQGTEVPFMKNVIHSTSAYIPSSGTFPLYFGLAGNDGHHWSRYGAVAENVSFSMLYDNPSINWPYDK